jgi:amino acid transporter
MQVSPFTIIRVLLGAYCLYFITRALGRRMRKGTQWRRLDPSLTQALYWLLWSSAAFLIIYAALLATAHLGGPSWLNTVLGAMLLLASLALTASIAMCGIRAIKEEQKP